MFRTKGKKKRMSGRNAGTNRDAIVFRGRGEQGYYPDPLKVSHESVRLRMESPGDALTCTTDGVQKLGIASFVRCNSDFAPASTE
jgi:hypothetical protein